MTDLKKLLGKRIQNLRKSKNITQERLAELIGIEPPSLSYIETGKYYPSVETLQKIAKILEVQPWELYYFHMVSEHEMKAEIKQAMEENPKLVKLFYSFYKSIEYC